MATSTLLLLLFTLFVASSASIEVHDDGARALQRAPQPHHGPQPHSASPRINSRNDLARYLNSKNFQTGAEVGVRDGAYAHHNLKIWTKCTKYILIDVWAKQENYVDSSNKRNDVQEQLFNQTQERLKPWANVTTFHRMYSSEAAKLIEDDSLDFVYLDARHDWCGVSEDMENYWPKLRKGGLMAGHDYMTAAEVRSITKGQDWSICANGTRFPLAVKGAVQKFAKDRGLTVVPTVTRENRPGGEWQSWMIEKPK